MHPSTILTASTLALIHFFVLANPLDREAATIDTALLDPQSGTSQQSGAGQQWTTNQQAGPKAGDPARIRQAERNGKLYVNARLFAEDLKELDATLVKFAKHPDPRERQWQRLNPTTSSAQSWWSLDAVTQSLVNQLDGV